MGCLTAYAQSSKPFWKFLAAIKQNDSPLCDSQSLWFLTYRSSQIICILWSEMSLNSCPWSAMWFFPVAGSQPCRKGLKLENDDQGEQTGSGESRVPGAPPSCLWDCQWVPFMTTFSLIERHILCCSGIGTIEGATKYFFSGQPSFTWILMRAVRAKSLQSCPILCDTMDCQAPLSKAFSRQE